MAERWTIVISAEVEWHLKSISKNQQVRALDALERHWVHQPDVETRNRKRLKDNPLATWELRVGEIRVYYNLLDAARRVEIVAIGEKIHNKIFIGGQERQL